MANLIDSFSRRFHREWNLIKKSKTNKGFIERIYSRLLRFLRNDPATKKLIEAWDEQTKIEWNIRYSAYRELSDACDEIRHASKDDPIFLMHLETVLEEVRQEGSCAFLKEQPHLYQSCYYKLRSLYVMKVSKNEEITFAPSAMRLIKNGRPEYLQARNDTDPRSLWQQLVNLAFFWAHREEIIYVGWPRIEECGLELWLKADEVRRNAFKIMIAGMLNHVDDHNFDKDYFDRKYFHELVERLFDEFILYLHKLSEWQYKPDKKNSSHLRTLQKIENQEKLTPIAIKIWHEEIVVKACNPELITNAHIVNLLKSHVKRYEISLCGKGSNHLYRSVVKKTSPKIYEKGRFIGLRSDFR